MDIKKYDLLQLAELISDPIALAPLLRVPRSSQNFKLNLPQQDFLTSNKKYTYFVAHRRAGKCVTGKTRVVNPLTLRPTRISELSNVKSNYVFDFKTNQIVESAAEWINSGKKECLTIKFLNQIEITLTYDHLLFVNNKGWIKAQDLIVGDEILAPSSLPIYGSLNPINDDICKAVDEALFYQKIDDSVFNYSLTALKSFFYVLFEEHGRLFSQEQTIIFHLKNSEMLYDVHHLLLRLGVWSDLDIEGNKVIIRGTLDVGEFLWKINKTSLQPTDVHAPRRWVSVVDYWKAGVREVYDIGVEHDDHNFVANDLIVHNSLVATYRAVHIAMTERDKIIYILAPSDKQVKLFFDSVTDWIASNPVVQEFWDRSGKNNNSQGNYIKSFKTGCKIIGHTTGNQESLRGITGHYFFLDEAQEFSEETWKAIGPFLRGDEHKAKEIKNFVIGTTNKPGEFYDVLLKKENEEWLKDKGKDYNVLFWPADKRVEMGDLDEEIFNQWRLETQSESEWNQEFLLRLGGGEKAVFQSDEINATFGNEYLYDDTQFSSLPHFIGVDWDKTQAGVNIVVAEYNPMSRSIKVVWREEFQSTEFHYLKAADRIIDLTLACQPMMLISDGMAAGQVMSEVLKKYAFEKGTDITNIHVPIFLNKTVDYINEANQQKVSEKIKPYFVSFIKNKMQNGLLSLMPSDIQAKAQFDSFKIDQITATTTKYSNKNEHIIDCIMFICYGIHLLYEGPDADLSPHKPSIISNYREIQEAMKPKLQNFDKWVKDVEDFGWGAPQDGNSGYNLRTSLPGGGSGRTLI